jgi:hypothetical protein
MVSRTVTAIAIASMLTFQSTPKPSYINTRTTARFSDDPTFSISAGNSLEVPVVRLKSGLKDIGEAS